MRKNRQLKLIIAAYPFTGPFSIAGGTYRNHSIKLLFDLTEIPRKYLICVELTKIAAAAVKPTTIGREIIDARKPRRKIPMAKKPMPMKKLMVVATSTGFAEFAVADPTNSAMTEAGPIAIERDGPSRT